MVLSDNIQEYSKEELLKLIQELREHHDQNNANSGKEIEHRKSIEDKLLRRSELLTSINRYSLELADHEFSSIYQFIVNKFKELFDVRAVWISLYDEKKSELIVEASTATAEDNSIFVRYLGKSVHRFHSPLSDENFKMIKAFGVGRKSSLHEISFGQIPQLVGLVIEKLLGIGWFQGITLIDKGKLFGTMVIAGAQDQEDLDKELLFVFAELTSNILRRRNTDERLLASEEKFRKAFLTSPDSININRLDDGKYISINSGFTRIMGYTEEEVIGRTSLELNIWKNPEDRKMLIETLRANNEVENMEASFISKSGSLKYGMMSAAIFTLEGIPHILSITRDITDKRNADIALQKSENRYRELVELAVDGILLGTSDGIIIDANSFMLNLTGRSLDQMTGKDIKELFSQDELIKNPLRFDLLKDGETVNCERQIIRTDASKIPVEMHTKMMPDGTYQSIFHDITERRKTSEQLVKLNECFLKFVNDPLANINMLVAIGGELLEATCSLYNRFDRGMLCSIGQWNTPPDFQTVDNPSGHICNDIIHSENDTVFVIRDLQNSKYSGTDPNVTTYRLSTYVGKAVKFGNRNIGSFCLVFQHDFIPDQNEIRLIEIIASAIGIEEDRNRSRQALLDSEAKLKSIFSAAPVGIGLVINRVIMEVNDSLCNMLGYSRDEFLGKSSEFIYSSRDEFVRAGNEKYNQIASTGSGSVETVFKTKEGKLLHIILSSTPLDKDDHSKGVTFTVLNITGRKESEEALRESENRYRELFLNNPVPTYIFDTVSLEFIEVNDAVVHNYGYSREEFSSMTLKDIRLPDDIPELIESVGSLGDNAFHSTSIRHVKKDGTIFPVEITSHALPEKNGRKSRLALVTDITERSRVAEQMKLARDKAESSDRLKTTFLNNISHEVRTPLNGILGFAEIITRPGLSEEDKTESVSMLYQSTDRLLKTITNYMDISLLTSGSMSANMKDFRPAQTLSSIFENSKSMCSARNLDLYLDIPESDRNLVLNSDKEIITKIISHFLDNAVKFTEKGSIGLGYLRTGTDFRFFVRDTGIGIGRESLDVIFEKFAKEEQGGVKTSEGSGLGLSIARGMSELIGGTVFVESERGKGSCLFLSLKLSSVRSNPTGEGSGIFKTAGITDMAVLIAEDDETNFFFLKTILSREWNVRIIHARNGREAIEFFRSNKDVKLVLMDIKMPEIDGLEATRQIKMMNSSIPVIAITAYAMSGDEERVIASGCDGYLSKPISKDRLLKKMAEFVSI